MWRRVLAGLIVCCLALAGAGLADAAAKKKKTKKAPAAPAISKPIYEAPMRVVIVRSSTSCEPLCPEWIAAEGEITGATPAAFSKVFKQMGKRKLPIIIRSPGGSINAALEIGRMIRKRGLDVSLGWTSFTGCAPDQKSCKLPPEQKGVYRGLVLSSRAFCNSACPLILAGGVTRLAPSDTYVGVHQPKTVWTREIVTYRERYRIVKGKKKVIDRKIVGRKPGKSRVTYGHDKALRKKLTAYYKEMGIDPKILDEAEKTKYKDIDYLTPAEVNQFHLRTLPTGPETLAGPKVCGKTPVPGNCEKSALAPKAALNLAVAQTNRSAESVKLSGGMDFHLVRVSSDVCEPTCPELVVATGEIGTGTAAKLEDFLKRLPAKPKAIVLDSGGGDPESAQDLGRVIRVAKLDTFPGIQPVGKCVGYDQKCLSKINTLRIGQSTYLPVCSRECLLAFAGGIKRVIFENNTYKMAGVKQAAGSRRSVLKHLKNMGVTSPLLDQLSQSREGDIVWFDYKQMRDFKLATWIAKSPEEYFSPGACKDKAKSKYCVQRP